MEYASSLDGDAVPLWYIGHHDEQREGSITDDMMQQAREGHYDMLTLPITTSHFYHRVSKIVSNSIPTQSYPVLERLHCADPKRLDTHLRPGQDISQCILTTSSWIDLSSPDPLIADVSRQVLSLEVQYASFCGATNLMIQSPRRARDFDSLSQYARTVQEALAQAPGVHFQILLPMVRSEKPAERRLDLASYASRTTKVAQDAPQETDVLETWEEWSLIRSVCNYSLHLQVALILPSEMPPVSTQSRWHSEPVRIVFLPGSCFTKLPQGDYKLSQSQQPFIFRLQRKNIAPWIMLSDIGSLDSTTSKTSGRRISNGPFDPTPAQASKQAQNWSKHTQPMKSHVQCLRQLQNKQAPKDAIEEFAAGYQDHLQSPLQPLADNLESLTYEVFEKDPIKYEWYERAISAALRDWKKQNKSTSGRNNTICLAVVGAGRGPLVTRALQASASTGVPIDVWAVEKNQNAFILLQQYFSEKWNKRVSLDHADMRNWKGPFYYEGSQKVHFKVDILVSELLGSFADNELSPECLDGVQHLLNPLHGISIPSSYTAHLTPIAAPKLHYDILTKQKYGEKDAPQIPYVVLLHAIDYLSTHLPPRHPDRAKNPAAGTPRHDPVPNIQQAWEFSHPNPHASNTKRGDAALHGNEHNTRFTRLEFRCRDRGVCHGLGGYFETVLYDPHRDSQAVAGGQEGRKGSIGTVGTVGTVGTDNRKASVASQGGTQVSEKIELSTNPLTMDAKSRDMISWFPIFFPLKTPLQIPDNSLLVVSMWRQTDGRKVWYEWMIESFLLGKAGSGGGGEQKRIRLGASELHSSVGSGCLM